MASGEGYDVLAVADGLVGLLDIEILRVAVDQNRWILTFDRGYGELIFARGMPTPPAVIFFGLRAIAPRIRGASWQSFCPTNRIWTDSS